jgi:radical SAM-linked protein
MSRDKVRIRFRKSGDLRFVSHHDLMRCFERMLRRANLPFRSTQGFHPKPRLVFALSLGLGIVGQTEVAELVLEEPVEPEEVLARLRQQAPPGLEFIDVRRIDPKAGAQVRRVVYRLPLAEPPADLADRCRALLQAERVQIERLRPQRKLLDIRPYLNDLRVQADGLELDLRVTPTGTARPDEIVRLLGLGDRLDAGAVLERIVLELEDELTENILPESKIGAPPRFCEASLTGTADPLPQKGTV